MYFHVMTIYNYILYVILLYVIYQFSEQNCLTLSGKRGPDLQKFDVTKYSTDTEPVYECSIAPSGCHSSNDCHYTVGVYCSCYGDSCIRHHEKRTTSGNTRLQAGQQKSKGWRWQGYDQFVVAPKKKLKEKLSGLSLEENTNLQVFELKI